MMRIFLFLLFFSISGLLLGQKEIVNIDVTVKSMASGKKEAGVTATVYLGSKVVASSVTTRNGRVNLTVPAGEIYKVEFTKAGVVPRFFNLNAKGIDMELIQDNEDPFVYCEVSIFEDVSGVDFSYVKNNPFTVFKFDGKSPNLAFDHNMADKMSMTITQLLEGAKRQEQNNEIQYQAKMKQAEQFAAQKKYQDAITSFEQALHFKPTDKVAIKRISDMEQLLTAEQADIVSGNAMAAEYAELVKQANALRDAKKYQDAIDKYEEALKKKRGDMYCIDEIERLEKLIKAEKEAKANEEKYKAAMALGTQMMGQKSYETALKKFEEALEAKPNDPTATAKKKEVEKLLDAQKEVVAKKQKYEQLIAEADQLYKDELWEQSKAKYKEALDIESASTYAQGRVKDIDAKLKAIQEEKAKQEQIAKLLGEGNTLFSQSKWQEAKDKYVAVQKLDAENAEAKSQIVLIDQKLKEEKDNAEKVKQFNDLVAKGDVALNGKKYEDAINSYQQALEIKVDTKVQEKIDQAKIEIEKLANAAKTKEMYDAAIKEADQLFKNNDFINAKVKYESALTLDNSQSYPKDQITKINQKLEALQQEELKKEQFNELIAQADDLMSAESYLEAKSKLEEAKKIDPSSKIPDEKIKAINDILAANKAKADQEKALQNLLAKADEFFNAEKYEEAINAYKEVLAKDDSNAKAKSQIEIAKDLLAKKKAEEEALLAKQKSDKEAAEKLAKYTALITAGDQLSSSKKYQDAIAKYEAAKEFIEDVSEVNSKIANVQQLIALEKEQSEAAAIEQQYLAAFNQGVQFQKEEKYEEAIKAYEQAKSISPSHPEPDQKIQEVKQIMEVIAAKLKDKEALEKQIANLLGEGDALVSSEQFKDAISKYEQAKALDANNPVIAQKIASAQKLLDEQNASKSAAEKKAQYQAFFSKGKEFMSQQKFDEAIQQFNEALKIEEKQEAKDKIKEAQDLKAQIEAQKSAEQLAQKYAAFIDEGEAFLSAEKYEDALSAFKNASNLMPDEEYPKKKMAEINDLIDAKKLQLDAQKREEEYLAALNRGDQLFGTNKYQEALDAFKEAAKIKNTDEVKQKMEATQLKIDELAKEQIEQQFADLMKQAADEEANKSYENAIATYKKANKLKPEEASVTEKIKALEKIIEADLAQKKVDDNYRLAMEEADDAFAKEDYNKAIEKYKLALTFKENEKRPKDQIEIALKKLEEISRRDEDIQFEKILQFAQQKIDERDFKKALDLIERAEDNRPNEPRLIKLKTEIQKQLAIDERYQEIIAQADEKLGQESYEDAKKLYVEAQNLVPTLSYPSKKIAEINDILSKNASEKQQEEEYVALLKKATNAKDKKDYDNALTVANQAKKIIPSDQRAKDLIDELEGLISAAKEAEEKSSLDSKFKEFLTKADQLFESKQWTKAKSNYSKALEIKPADKYVKDQIARCTEIAAQEELNKSKYLAIVSTADLDYKAGEYEKAIKGYELALTYDGANPYPQQKIRQIRDLLARQSRMNGKGLDNLGDEQIDISLAEGAALLAAAENSRRNNKGQLIKEKRNIAIDRNDSIGSVSRNFVDNINDSLKLTKEINVQDLSDYYAQQFDIDKKVKDINKDQDDWYHLIDGYTYNDQVDNKDRFRIIDGMIVDRHKEYIDFNFELVDAMRNVDFDIDQLRADNTLSDYDEILRAKRAIHDENELQIANQLDDIEEHWEVIHIVKSERENAVEENKRQKNLHDDKLESAKDLIVETEDIKRENDRLQVKSHDVLLDRVKENRAEVIEVENQNYNDVYTKQLKAKTKVVDVQTDEHERNLAYLEDKSLDIDRSRTRLNDANLRYSNNEMSDDAQREEARLFLKGSEQLKVNKDKAEKEKNGQKGEDVKQIVKDEQTLQRANNLEKKDELYDVRSELKRQQYAEVQFPPKVANTVGKNYPEGVSQEVFKENGPDGLPIAIITRRIVVKNGYGDVYVRTQKYGSLTYSKNGEVCTEMIWRNGTTDPKLEKHY